MAKMVGDMDYKKIRNSETTLTEKEIDYCINDVKVVTMLFYRHDGENRGKSEDKE